MNKSIIYFLFLFAVCAFSTNMVFAGSPIPGGLDVKLGKNPGGKVFTGKTDKDGKFSVKLEEGKYGLTISYDDIVSKVSRIDKNYASNPDSYAFILTFDEKSWDLLENVEQRRQHRPVKILKEWGKSSPQINVPKGGGALSGTLTYEKIK